MHRVPAACSRLASLVQRLVPRSGGQLLYHTCVSLASSQHDQGTPLTGLPQVGRGLQAPRQFQVETNFAKTRCAAAPRAPPPSGGSHCAPPIANAARTGALEAITISSLLDRTRSGSVCIDKAVQTEEFGPSLSSKDLQAQGQEAEMMLNSMNHTSGLTKRASPNGMAHMSSVQARPVACRVAAEAATAWDSWTPYMGRKKATNLLANSKEIKYFVDIGAMISKSAIGYTPKFNIPHEPHGSAFKTQHANKAPAKELPKDLHDKLEAIGVATLKGALSLDELDYANASYTTTDIDGALSITGTVVQKGTEKSAVIVFVATETEREASWSRLDGLMLHWACSATPGAPWSMPPDGWTAAPKKTTDKGGAWECCFEKQTLANNEQMYVLVMQLPLRGVLKTGGVVFVLKGEAAKTDRWLKDASTDKDFFLGLASLPVTKV